MNLTKKASKFLRQYLPFSSAGVKGVLAYKAQTFMWLFIAFIDIFFIIFLYQAIYRNSPEGMSSIINGFTFYEMVLYMITSFVFSFVVNSSETSWNIFQDIKEGTIANTLTKPVSYRLRHLFTYIGGMAFLFVIMVLPILTIVYGIFIGLGLVEINVSQFIINFLIFLVLTVLGGFINDAISYFVGMLTFFTEHMFGLNFLRNSIQSFLSGSLVPLSFMGAFGIICSYTPFAFLNSTPVLTLMCKFNNVDALIYVGVAFGWLVFLELVNHLMFKFCIRRVTVQGG